MEKITGLFFEKSFASRLADFFAGGFVVILSLMVYWNLFVSYSTINTVECSAQNIVVNVFFITVNALLLLFGVFVSSSSFYKNIFIIKDECLVLREIDKIDKCISWEDVELKDNIFGRTNVWDNKRYEVIGSFYSHWKEYKGLSAAINDAIYNISSPKD